MKRVCIIGCGAIGSLYAAHLARVAEVWALVRRADHADALNRDGLRVSGKHNFSVSLKATTDPKKLPDFDLGIVATKATQVEEAIAEAGKHFDGGTVISAQPSSVMFHSYVNPGTYRVTLRVNRTFTYSSDVTVVTRQRAVRH